MKMSTKLIKEHLIIPAYAIATFSFLFNFPWEFLQVPFFHGFTSIGHWEGTKTCTQATFGDAVISLIAYFGVAAFRRNGRWMISPDKLSIVLYMLLGVIITIFMEWLATDVLNRWQYSDNMPRLPLLGTGLLPLLQWIILPPCILYFSKRHIR